MTHAIQLASEASPAMSLAEVTAFLAQTLGDELATKEVSEAAATLGIPGPALTSAEVNALLGHLSEEPGLVGLSATLAKSHLHFQRGADLLDKTKGTP